MAKSKKPAKFAPLSNLSKQRLVIIAVFVLGFGGIGLYKLAYSSAAKPVGCLYTCSAAGNKFEISSWATENDGSVLSETVGVKKRTNVFEIRSHYASAAPNNTLWNAQFYAWLEKNIGKQVKFCGNVRVLDKSVAVTVSSGMPASTPGEYVASYALQPSDTYTTQCSRTGTIQKYNGVFTRPEIGNNLYDTTTQQQLAPGGKVRILEGYYQLL